MIGRLTLSVSSAPALASLRALMILAAALGFLPPAFAGTIPSCRTNVSGFLKEYNVTGIAAGIVKEGKLVCTAVAGDAVIGTHKVTPDTDFIMASVSKTITATALLQLYEKGKFQLDDDVNDYLPFEVHVPTCSAEPITFRQLLTHTSSIQDNYDVLDSLTVQGDSRVPLKTFMREYFTPGGKYYNAKKNFYGSCPDTALHYSNLGATLVGYLVQVLSGQEFNEYCEEHIFKPLDMPNTSYFLRGLNRATLAMPYDGRNGKPLGQFGEADFPDGMVRTSINQLSHFLILYMQEGRYKGRQILQPETVRLMLSEQTPFRELGDTKQGLIWFETEGFHHERTWGHDGDDNGVSSYMFFNRDSKVGVIAFANGEWQGDVGKLTNALFEEANQVCEGASETATLDSLLAQ